MGVNLPLHLHAAVETVGPLAVLGKADIESFGIQ